MPRGLQAELKQLVPFTSPEQEAYLSLLRTADRRPDLLSGRRATLTDQERAVVDSVLRDCMEDE